MTCNRGGSNRPLPTPEGGCGMPTQVGLDGIGWIPKFHLFETLWLLIAATSFVESPLHNKGGRRGRTFIIFPVSKPTVIKNFWFSFRKEDCIVYNIWKSEEKMNFSELYFRSLNCSEYIKFLGRYIMYRLTIIMFTH